MKKRKLFFQSRKIFQILYQVHELLMKIAKNKEKEYDIGYSKFMDEDAFPFKNRVILILGGLILFGIYLTSGSNYLLFHNLAEIFSVIVAAGIFIIAWNSRRFLENGFFLLLGIAFLFFATIDLLHTLAYKGMGIFPEFGTDLATSLWIAARYTQAISFAVAPLFLRRKLKAAWAISAYAVWTALLLLSIFYWKVFPISYVEGVGLTTFKKVSEYIISLILIGSIVLLNDRKNKFDKKVYSLLVWSIVVTIASELSFTLYIDVYGFFNKLGHFLKIISFYLIYRAIIVTAFEKPYDILFRGLKQSQQALQSSEQRLSSIVQTAGDAIISTDSRGTIISWNNGAQNIFGYEADETIGKPVTLIMPEKFQTAHRQGMQRVLETDEQRIIGKTVEMTALGKNNTEFPIELSLSRWKTKDDSFFTAIIRDITERKKDEEKLKHLASFPQMNPSPVLEISSSGKITFFNSATQKILKELDLNEENLNIFLPEDIQSILKRLEENVQISIYREISIKDRIFSETIFLTPQFNVARIYAYEITKRKRSEEALRESEERFKAIAETAPIGIGVVGVPEAKFLYINPAYEKTFGYEERELLDKETPQIYWNTEDQEKILEELNAKGNLSEYEVKLKHKDGTPFWGLSSVRRITYSGKPALLGVFFDITDRKKYEVKLKETQNYLESLIGHANAPIIVWDPKNKIVRFNQAFEHMTGYIAKEVIGKDLSILFPPETREQSSKEIEKTSAGKFWESVEIPILRKDGQNRIVLWNSANIYEKDDKTLIATIAQGQDITSRKKMVEKISTHAKYLEEEKAKDEAILSSIGHGIVAADNERRVLFVNQGFEHISGYSKKDLIGKDITQVIKLENEKGIQYPIEKTPVPFVLSSGKRTSSSTATNYLCIRKDGTKIPVAITATPIILDKKVIGAIAVYRDITRERQIDRAKTEFVSLASHQLRTPLANISLSSEMLLGGIAGETTKEQRKYLRTIFSSVREMTELIEALLNVSRIEMGTLIISPEPTNIGEFINKLISSVSMQLRDKKLFLKKSFDEDIPVIEIDKRLMTLVFDNLISNAIKYTPKEGQILVEIKKRVNDVLICISDTGCGIPIHQHSQVFTKLFRSDNALKAETKGTGLGLYIVQAAVSQYGGKVWFKSDENKGTAFYFTVPLKGMKKKDKIQENLFPVRP